MSRIVSKDFEELIKYIDNFNLKPLLAEHSYKDLLSTYHKKYFSFFILTTELEAVLPETEFLFLKEANSDLITCLFHLSTGNYKSAKLLLRSSIECFLKGFTQSWITNIHKEKSVYEIFDKIKILAYFSNEPYKTEFNNIHNIYKTLCKDVHTADNINMASINSLDFFPKYSKKHSNSIIRIILKLVPSYCFLLANKYNSSFHKIHHTHKEIIMFSIERNLRPNIMNTIQQ